MARAVRLIVVAVVGLAFVASAASEARAEGQSPQGSAGKVRLASQKQAKKKTAKKGRSAAKSETEGEAPEKLETPKATESTGSELKFSRDIAPILIANCSGCHDAKQKRGKFDMTTFELLMKGTASHTVIEAGKPDDSHLVLRIRGEETPKMPQGANRNLSDDAIARIEKWVNAGAVLDAGIDPKAPMAKYAATPDDLRKADLARMAPEQRDKHVETVGLERWKKAGPKLKPEVTPGTHFLFFGNVPKPRASAALKVLETQFTQLKSLLGPTAVEWGEKASLYVFNDAASFGEFVRSAENREVESGEIATAKFSVPEPYVAVVDPQGGRDESPTAATSKRPGRSKRGESNTSTEGGERSLPGVLTEQFVTAVVGRSGKPPRWLTLGLGAQHASRVEPRAAYFQKLRRDAAELARQGWVPKANEALGDSTKAESVRAVGFAILDSLSNSPYKAALPQFVRGMSAGGDRIDNVLGEVLDLSREQFLNGTGEFVETRYGNGR